jgi:hypothetical protein
LFTLEGGFRYDTIDLRPLDTPSLPYSLRDLPVMAARKSHYDRSERNVVVLDSDDINNEQDETASEEE